jgi:hypothetical protein
MSKMKKMIFKTPTGKAMYPYLNRPDTQFDSEGKYKVDLRLKKEEAAGLLADIRKAAKEAFGDKADTATLPFEMDADTGEVIVKTKSKYRPQICDSTGQVLPEHKVPNIFGGSQLVLGGTLTHYTAGGRHGISMQLGGVQIVNLTENANTAGIAFAPVEGGFVAANDNDEASEEAAYNF